MQWSLLRLLSRSQYWKIKARSVASPVRSAGLGIAQWLRAASPRRVERWDIPLPNVGIEDAVVHFFEVKSSMSFNADFFKNLRYLQALMPSDVASTQVIYDGTEQRDTTFDGIRNFRSL